MTTDESDVYEDRLLGAPDVCNNCFCLIRVERIDPVRTGIGRAYESTYERNPRTTTVEYAPADTISDEKGVFCTCGVEGARDRVWEAADVDRERFRTFVKAVLWTLEAKGLSIHRQRASESALQRFADGAAVDDALAAGVSAGLSSRTQTDRVLAD